MATNLKNMSPNMNRLRAKTKSFDYNLFIITIILLVFGLVILYSASSVVSYTVSNSSTYYFSHQLIFGAIIGLFAMYIMSRIDYHVWQKYAPLIIIISILLLGAVLFPGIGAKVGNSRRWFAHGFVSLQPSEIAKLALIFYIASWLDKRKNQIKDLYFGVIPLLIIIGTVAGLIILEPDIGTTLVVIAISLIMIFVGGTRLRHLAWIILLGLVGFFVLVKLEPYRIKRFTAFMDPNADPQGIGYQVNQALVAIGSGGLFGYGYGNSRQKYNYLPQVIGDSIFAIVVEELGLIGAGVLITFYYLFAMRGLKISKGSPDMFGKMVAVGIVAWIVLQAIINIGAISAIFPLTGIPLPFVSYGSSALIVNLAAIGVLLNISKHSTI